MNFQYSPGLIGYGPKGLDGSAGLPGLAIYFTDYDPQTDFLTIRSAIENDEVLLSQVEPGTKLSGDRTYNPGDLFVTSRGYVFEITKTAPEYFIETPGALSKSEYFDTNNEQADHGFQRMFNINDPNQDKFIIDNNNSSRKNYLNPSKVYGVDQKNFTRIEYTDGSTFTLYSSAENKYVDDNRALALITTNNGNFRLGNIGDTIRDTNLKLDVSLLQYNKPTPFGINTPSQTVLTNKEKNTNILFDDEFNYSPNSFTLDTYGVYSVISWNLLDFTSDPSIKGTLVFNKVQDIESQTWNVNNKLHQPLMFHNLEKTGSLTITDLSIGTKYEYYMIIEKDGWERKSEIREIEQQGSPAYLNILKPASKMLYADYLGNFSPADPSKNQKVYGVDISTSSITGWNVNRGSYTWIDVSGGSGITPGQFTFDVSLGVNSLAAPRIGYLNILSEATPQIITVNQSEQIITASFNNFGYLVFDTPLTDQTLSVQFRIYAWVRVRRNYTLGSRRCRASIVLRQGVTTRASASEDQTAKNGTKDSSSYTTYSASVNVANQGQWKVWYDDLECHCDRFGEECGACKDDYKYSQVWAEIVNITKYSGTGKFVIGSDKYWYAKNMFPMPPNYNSPNRTCTIASSRAATVPAMPAFP